MPRVGWRTLLVEWPARVVDVAWQLYLAYLIAMTIACWVGVILLLAAYALGFPLFDIRDVAHR